MFNFVRKNIKSAICVISASAIVISNAPGVLANGYDTDDYENLFENSYVIAMSHAAPTVIAAARQGASNTDVVTYYELTETESISYQTVKKANNNLEAGKSVTTVAGQNGEKVLTIRVKYINGQEVSRERINEYVKTQPVDEVVEYSTKQVNGVPPVSYKYVLECTATAYDMSPEENGGYGGQTATGIPLDEGVIAVDPRVIPLGSKVYIEALDGSWSYGYAVAGDTGGAIKGNKVDLCYRTRYQCIQFGRRKCRVYVIE